MAETIGQTIQQPGQQANQPGQAPAPGIKQPGSRFTNISKMFAANQGNQVGSTVGAGISEKASDVARQSGSALSDFNKQLQGSQQKLEKNKQREKEILSPYSSLAGYNQPAATQATPPSDYQSATNQTIQNPNVAQSWRPVMTPQNSPERQAATQAELQAQIASGVSDIPAAKENAWGSTPVVQNPPVQQPTPFDWTQNQPSQVDINTLAAYQAGGYTGPTGLENTGQLQQLGQQVGQYGNLAQTQGGKQALLQGFLGGKGGYTPGQQMLDLLFMRGQGLQSGAQNALGAQQLVGKQIGSAGLAGQQMAQNYGQFGQQTAQDLAAAQTGLQSQLGQQATAHQSLMNKYVEDAQKQLAGAGDINMSLEEAQALGFADSQGNPTVQHITANAGQYFTPGTTEATGANDYSAQQAAQLYALQRLSGQDAGSIYAPKDGQFGTGDFMNQNKNAWNAASANTDYQNMMSRAANDKSIRDSITGALMSMYNNPRAAGGYESSVNQALSGYGTSLKSGALQDYYNKSIGQLGPMATISRGPIGIGGDQAVTSGFSQKIYNDLVNNPTAMQALFNEGRKLNITPKPPETIS